MTVRTDYDALMLLKERLNPEQGFVLSKPEEKTIRETLELDYRTEIELQNARNMAVMLCRNIVPKAIDENGIAVAARTIDFMSAVCAVIDKEKAERGIDIET